MTTRVVNIRSLPRDPADWPPDHVYIGRANARRGLARSAWANPWYVNHRMTREWAIWNYETSLRDWPDLLERLPELKDKVLVCWCHPLPCHGDVLARLADER